MREQQVTFRPLNYPNNSDIDIISSSLGDKIVEEVMHSRISSESKFWSRIFSVAKEYKKSNEAFFAKPQWEGIEEWLEGNSFRFSLESNHVLFVHLFDSLNKTSDSLHYAFTGEECPSNVNDLCSEYLCAYYSLVNRLQERGVLRDDSICGSPFLHMLKTGYKIDGNNGLFNIGNGLFFRFFSPVFMENLRVFYNFIENDVWYQSKLFDGDKNIKLIYKDIISEKFKHLFFIEVTQFNDRYISRYYNIKIPQLMNRDNFSSIEPIRPVRWLDKIKAYAEKLKNSKKGQQGRNLIKIAAVGYVNLNDDDEDCISSELGMFYETLYRIRTEDFGGDYNFEINIFPNSNDKYFEKLVINDCVYTKSENGICVNIKFVDYSKFFSLRDDIETNLCKVINEHDIVLLEDVPNIYTHEYKLLKKSGRNFPDSDSGSDYEFEYERMDFKNEDFLVLNYRYAPINLLTSKLNLISMNEDVYEDTLKYRLNLPLINYLREYMERMKEDQYDDREHNVYIFTSKKSGVDFSDYVQDNFTREERYNAKNFYLITLSNRKSKELRMRPRGERKTFIVFSLWNMLKNIDYNFIESVEFFNDILHCEKEEVCALAMKIYIKMSWDFPNKEFLFEICFDREFKRREFEPDKQLLKGFLECLFEIIFSPKKNLFARCVGRSFLNVVYSQMEYIEDAVFYCVLYNSFSENDKLSATVRFSDFEEQYVYSVNQPIFWNLTSILKLLNENVFRGDRIWEINKIYEKNKDIYRSAELSTLNVFLQRVKEICEEYGYTDSNLYRNTVSLLA